MKKILILIGVVLAAYVGIYEGLLQGVVHIVEGIKDDLSPWTIAEGVLRVILASPVATIIFWLFMAVAFSLES